MKEIILYLFIFILVFSTNIFAEERKNKAGWSSACEMHAIRYCNKNYKRTLSLYKECVETERACGKELFDIVYPKKATEDELWECNRKFIKLLRDNNMLSEFIMYEYSYCELLAIVLEQWEK